MSRRIALISEHASPLALLGGVDAGGQNVYVAHVAHELATLGDQVDVYTRRDDPALPRVVETEPGVRVIHVDAGPPAVIAKERLLPYMADFHRWMVRDWTAHGRRYDVVHANFFMSGLVASQLRDTLGVPFVVTFHALGAVRRRYQGPDDGFPADRVEIETRVATEADRVIAECPQDEDDLIRLYGADPRRIAVVPCGFDPAEFTPTDPRLARRELGLDPDERVILQLGRIVPRKGIDTVIQALGRLCDKHEASTRLLVVGGSSRRPDPDREPELARLIEIARAEGVADLVTFVGRRDRGELGTFYNAADVFVSTPWYEPFGITPLEAMACGTPVIGSAVGGVKFTVRDGETGYLVPPNDPDALADRLARLLSDPQLRATFTRRAIQHVNSKFTWGHVATQLSEVYDDVLAQRRAVREPVTVRAVRAAAAAAAPGEATADTAAVLP
jgi:D-inositol-3-phosphate glycosyltransferase